MHKLLVTLFLSTLFSGLAQANLITSFPARRERGGGVVVGNGGYSIQCGHNGGNRSYDLLMAEEALSPAYRLRPVSTREKSFEKIRALIASKLPAFKASFDEFENEIFTSNNSNKYVWEANYPWLVGTDSLPMSELFSNHLNLCLGSRDISEVNLTQTILREPHQEQGRPILTFYYDIHVFYELPQLDRSFLLVHEWLWNFTDDININREADFILHSTWLDHASSKDVIDKFRDLGIQYP